MRQNSISGWAKLEYRSGPCRSIGAEAQHALRMEHGVYASRSIQCGRPGAGFGPVYGGAHMSAAALEKHYRVREVAALWGFSDNTIIGIFASEPGVIRLESGVGRRKYTTLSIPESLALRIHERLGQVPLQTQLSAGNPLRVIRLRDLYAGMAKKPRNVLKLKSGQQPANRERVSEAMRPTVGKATGRVASASAHRPHLRDRQGSCWNRNRMEASATAIRRHQCPA